MSINFKEAFQGWIDGSPDPAAPPSTGTQEASTLFMQIRKTGSDGLNYRPDEEISQKFYMIRDDRPERASDNNVSLIERLTPWEITLFGFLAGLLGAAAGVLAGFAMSTSWLLWAWAMAGTILVSTTGWLTLVRRR